VRGTSLNQAAAKIDDTMGRTAKRPQDFRLPMTAFVTIAAKRRQDMLMAEIL
jgi:hypothetical protein